MRTPSCSFTARVRLGLGVVAGLAVSALATPTFYNLGVFPAGGTFSQGGQVSADGWIVSGYGDVNTDEQWGNRAFRWTLAGGMQDLGVPFGSPWSAGNSISADGSATAGNLGVRGFRWTNSGIQNLGTLPGGTVSISYGVSGNGSIVVGYSNNGSTYLATRWTAAGGMQDIGTLPGGYAGGSAAQGISSDGFVIVGSSAWSGSSFARAFRWTSAGGMQNLGILFGGTKSFAYSASTNGAAIAGEADFQGDESGGDRAFRWTASTGMVGLGVPPGAGHSYGHVISGDGLVVAGRAKLGNGTYRACLWTNMIGMVDLQNYLATQGLNLPGWTLTDARGLSTDGSAISGTGVFNGQTRAFLVRGVNVPSFVRITREPIDRITGPGGTVVFDTEVEGSAPISYLWQWRSIDGPTPSPWTDIVEGVNGGSVGEALFIAANADTDHIALTNMLGSPGAGMSSRREVHVIVGNGLSGATSADAAWTTCYANCDTSSLAPVLNANDFQCFLNRFAGNEPYANCDGSAVPPMLNANDFQCFLNEFASGCP